MSVIHLIVYFIFSKDFILNNNKVQSSFQVLVKNPWHNVLFCFIVRITHFLLSVLILLTCLIQQIISYHIILTLNKRQHKTNSKWKTYSWCDLASYLSASMNEKLGRMMCRRMNFLIYSKWFWVNRTIYDVSINP